ncbi:hypothetical protein GGQ92_003183 [Gracilibacillus halotolerans]|uniref:DNA (cytosine-5-)-methyltransferase n=1 Tax=Gracilibacillus halotolerans TaxID=74386 RepID=A0A841RPB0_9BACI|nr:hypothetical protein [Gracilibacillus halotolerans]
MESVSSPLSASRFGISPTWASEIEKAPMSITKRHFPNMIHLGDITKLNGGEIPPVHIITFGSPCQNLSNIGKREGLTGSQSSLFYHAIRIIEEMRCQRMEHIQLSLFWKTSWELSHQITGWILRPCLNRSHASLLISMGENPLIIKDRLGHEDIETTLGTYGHLYPNSNFEVAHKLEGIMSYQTATENKDTSPKNQFLVVTYVKV